eukprot:g3561.t1
MWFSRSLLFTAVATAVVGVPAPRFPANKNLVSANTPSIGGGPLLYVDAPNASHGWLPPALSPWVTDREWPLQSEPLVRFLRALGLGGFRYPGGAPSNWLDWHTETFAPAALNCSLNAHCSWYKLQADLMAALSPGAFGVEQMDKLARSVGAELTLTLCVSAGGPPDSSVPGLVASKLPAERVAGARFELGNEQYDPRQGPQPGGWRDAAQYLAAVEPVAAAVRAVGGIAGVPVAPCPFFYPDDRAACWGGPDGRYHQWQRNFSTAYANDRPFDAVVAHNYVLDLGTLAKFAPEDFMSVFLAVPAATMANGAASMRRYFPDATLWVSEYNAMYADVWHGHGDAAHPAAAAFLNATENSGAHAVFAAAHVLAGAANAGVVRQMGYHSLLDRAGPTSLGPNAPTESQPGFAVAALNATAGYISPVAQALSMLARLLEQPGATTEALDSGAEALGFTLAPAGLGDNALPCVQALAVCAEGAAPDTVLAVNRCPRTVAFAPPTACGRAPAWPQGWGAGAARVYNASLAPFGRDWAQLVGPSPSLPWDHAVMPTGGAGGMPIQLPRWSLVVVTVSNSSRSEA